MSQAEWAEFVSLCVSIDVNGQHWNIGGIDADRSSQNFRLLHQVWRDLTLNSHNRLHSSVRIIQNTSGRASERAD